MPLTGSMFCEAFISGGPRHGHEMELCEDAAGFISARDGCAFYIADATSDEGHLGPFSSRYLANSLGHAFIKEALDACTGPIDGVDVTGIMDRAVASLDDSWRREFAAYMQKQDAQAEFERSAEPFVHNGLAGKLKTFSTTFCGGVISEAGRVVKLVRTGDIDIVIKRREAEPTVMPLKKQRIFLRFIRHDGGRPELAATDYQKEYFAAWQVEYIIVKSDGLKFANDAMALKILSGGTRSDLMKFRKLLLKGVESVSGDDKAMFYSVFLDG